MNSGLVFRLLIRSPKNKDGRRTGNLDSDTRSIGCKPKAAPRELKAKLVQCCGSEGALQLRDDREISGRIVGGSGERILNLELVLPIANLPGNV